MCTFVHTTHTDTLFAFFTVDFIVFCPAVICSDNLHFSRNYLKASLDLLSQILGGVISQITDDWLLCTGIFSAHVTAYSTQDKYVSQNCNHFIKTNQTLMAEVASPTSKGCFSFLHSIQTKREDLLVGPNCIFCPLSFSEKRGGGGSI